MSQNDFSIANQTFPNTRTDINSALQALASTSSGTSIPATTYANQFWYDTSTNTLFIRNEDNDANITILTLDQTNDTVEFFKSDSVRTALLEFTDGTDALTIGSSGELTTAGNLSIGGSNNELRFYEGANYVGFEAPALTGDQIFVLPTADGSANQALITNGSGTLSFASVGQSRNIIINGGMNVSQRGTSFTSTSSANNDDSYTLDRFYIVSDGNDIIDVTQTTTVPSSAKNSIGLDVETVNKKFGIAQIIENVNCFDAIGGSVTLSFQAKVSSTTKLDNVKCAIIAWSGTVDTVTSDIISAWGVEGTNPTLIANATYENSPANLNVTTSFASYSVTATVDTASTTNIIVFIWSDVTDTTLGDFLHITNVQLEKGTAVSTFAYKNIAEETNDCLRYYQTSYDNGTSAGTSTSVGIVGVNAAGTGVGRVFIGYPIKPSMRAIPTITIFSTDGTSGTARRGDASANVAVSTGNASNNAFHVENSATVTDGEQIQFQYRLVSEL